jgi:GNAT superfamily N-acetyltransferase
MWQEYLPDTMPERYEWLNIGSPAGKAWWFLALDDQSKILLGFITLLPRQIIWKGEKLLSGIMGDFVVDKPHRGFGLGLQLPRHALDKALELGFSLIYVIPYYGSIKHFERAGLRHKIRLRWLIKPLDFRRYVRNPIAARTLNIAALLFDRVSQSLFLNPFVLRGSYFEEVESIGHDFDNFWAKLKNGRDDILGSRDSRYLTWRYLQNPLMKFQVLTFRQRASEDLLGYVIFTINGGKLDVYDIQYLQKKVKYLLVQKLIRIAKRERCEAVYILLSAGDNALSTLKVFGFIPSEGKNPLCYAAMDPELNLDTWRFFQGDRNV